MQVDSQAERGAAPPLSLPSSFSPPDDSNTNLPCKAKYANPSGDMGLFSRFFRPKIQGEQSFGLNELDLKLKPYLDFEGGFFIETGANDGLRQSNTCYFEKYRGWRGLLIEPIPKKARRCRRNRPNSIVEQCALVAFDFPHPVIRLRLCNLMTVVKGGMKSEAEELEHLRQGAEFQKIKKMDELTVPARTLTSILDKHHISKIDFFSLDVEGYELNVLRGLDFDRYRPTLMLIEARYRAEIEDYIGKWYDPIAELSHHDVLYRVRGKSVSP